MPSVAPSSATLDRKFLIRLLSLIVAYTVAGVFVLEFRWQDVPVGRVVWPSAGIAVAALIVWGRHLWVGVAIAGGLVTALTGGSLAFVLSTVVGNALEAWIVAALIDRWGFRRTFGRSAYVIAFSVAALIGGVLSAGFGVAGMYVGGDIPARFVDRVSWLWAGGHTLGTLLFGPALLLAGDLRRLLRSHRRLLELAAILAALAAVGFATFVSHLDAPLSYLPFPLLIWAALRFGPLGAAVANVVVGVIALRWTAYGLGPFAGGEMRSEDYLFTWCYATVAAVTTSVLAATVEEGRQAENERRRRETDYRLLIEQAADGVLIFDAQGVCVDANSSACQMLGRRLQDMIDCPGTDFVADDQAPRLRKHLRNLRPGKAAVFSWRMQRPDGSSFPAEVSVKRFEDGRTQAFLRDDTRRRSLEEQLSQAQKMDAVGQLAGGVAHEFNNILTLILGHIFAIRSHTPAGSQNEDRLLRVIDAAERAGKLTRRLLAFARKQTIEPQLVTLNDLVSESADIVPRLLGEDIHYVAVLSSEPWKVYVDPGQLQQVALNIALNARDAMPDGGQLVIECRNVHLQGAACGSLPEGDYASLVMTDTGVGMDPDVRSRIFEPFFTTKSRKEGTGLGLAVSYGIIKQAGGDIRVKSEPGKGASVVIYLPRVESEEPEQVLRPSIHEAPIRKPTGETILVIEDEEGLRELAVSALEERGYIVLTAGDGEEAVRLSKQRGAEPVDLIIADVVLPGISGPEAVRAMRRLRPEIRALFVSGYPEERMASDELRHVGTGFLAKPFTPPELLTAVSAILEGSDRNQARGA